MKLILLGHRPLEMKQMINTTLLKKHLVHAVCRVLFWVIEYKDKVSALKVFQFSSVQFSHSVISDSMWPHEPQHARPPCPSPTSEVHSDSCPLSQWCHLIISFCRLLLLLPSIFPSIRVFSNESALRIRWPKYWSFSLYISPFKEHSGLTSFRMNWFDLLAVQGTLKSLLQHHSSKASILWHSAFFVVQLSHPYMTTGKTKALTRRTFIGKVISLLSTCCLGWS